MDGSNRIAGWRNSLWVKTVYCVYVRLHANLCVFALLLLCVCVRACVYQWELGCSTLSPTSDGGICPAAVEEAALGGEALRPELPVEEAVTAGRMSGGGGWLWGARFWSGRVWRGGGWRRRLGGAEGGAGRSSGGGCDREEWVWVEEVGDELLAASEGEFSILTWGEGGEQAKQIKIRRQLDGSCELRKTGEGMGDRCPARSLRFKPSRKPPAASVTYSQNYDGCISHKEVVPQRQESLSCWVLCESAWSRWDW